MAWPSFLKLPKITSFQNSCNVFRKKWGINLLFVPISITIIYKLILSFLMCVARHAWSAQNNSHAVFFQYLRTELSYIVDVLHADKGESFLQVDSIIFDGFDQACPNYLGKFLISLWNIKKEVRNESLGLNCTGWFKCYSYNLLYFPCPPTIDPFPHSVWNPYQDILHLNNCFCNISSLLFQVTLHPCKLVFSS